MNRRRRMTAVAAVVATVWQWCPVSSAITCPDAGGIPAPDVVTLMASAMNDDEAWVVSPSCKVETLKVTNTGGGNDAMNLLDATGKNIERVVSFPKVQRLDLGNNAVREADFTNPSGLIHIILAWSHLKTVDNFKFPSTLEELDFEGNSIQRIASGVIPNSVKTLYLGHNDLTTASNIALPDSLNYLSFQNNKLTLFNLPIPDGLSTLELSNNKLTSLENFTMPSTLTKFLCANCGIQSIRGVQLSSQLLSLQLDKATPTTVEVRETDLAVLKSIKQLELQAQVSSCDDSSARQEKVKDGLIVCVISDARFEEKYANRLAPSKPGSGAAVPSSSTVTNEPSPLMMGTPSPSNSSPESSVKTTAGGSPWSSTVITIVSVVIGVVCLVVIAIGYRVFGRTRKQERSLTWQHTSDESTDNKYRNAGMASTLQLHGHSFKTNPSSSALSQEYLSNDVRNDEELIPFRIDQDEIKLLKVIAKGGFGVIHLGRVRGRDVAVKQLLPERSRDTRAIKSFMDEIRMCARLDHPKIVAFIGLSWTTLLDMAVIIEYMRGGDLGLTLYSQKREADPYYWFEPTAQLKPKNLLALDVIEAVVYLHSFDSPIIHRDLKARNVLLDDKGDAKLSDFGISRELALEETMTGEVGTVAWIAPEVLHGDRYSEKADIYSFGVFMVELDTGRHPYHQNLGDDDSTPQSNARIALLVSAGEMAPPQPSFTCPEAIRDLALRCMSFHPHDRPSALEIHYELRKIQARGSQSGQLV